MSRIRRIIRDVDATRPTVPAGLAGSPISETAINIGWNASSDPQGLVGESISGVAGYRLYRNDALRIDQAGITFGDTGLTAFTVYAYHVKSYDAAGNESLPSATIQPRTLDTTAPTAPVITATQTGQTSISVALTTPSTDTGSGVATYRLEYKRTVDVTWSLDGATLTAGQFPRSITGLVAATQYDTRERATDVSGNVGNFSVVSQATTQSGGALPPGVTLQAIDGGPTFYADHGFTYAVGMGWDDPDFFPVGCFLVPYVNSTHAARMAELGWNTAFLTQGTTNLALMNTNGVSLILQSNEWLANGGNNLYHALLRGNVVGLGGDEPNSIPDATDDIENFPNQDPYNGGDGQDERLWFNNFVHHQVTNDEFGGISMNALLTLDITTPNASIRHIDIPSMDWYWMSGRFDASGPQIGGQMMGIGRNMTDDEQKRPIRYGDTLKIMRTGAPNGRDPWKPGFPMSLYIEPCAPYAATNLESEAIRPAQINAAVWGAIICGARHIQYFDLGDGGAYGLGGLIGQNFWETPLPGESISNYAQVVATDALIAQLASVINSPVALGYATVSPPPVTITNSIPDSGFEFMVKYHNRGVGADNRFYIFAVPRWSEALSNQVATFTIPNTGATQVTVINESRTIPITGGGTTFEDTFATYCTVHIYRVDD